MTLLIGALLGVGLCLWLFETKWPPQVEANELSRIGPPMPSARKVGNPYTWSGSVICLDACLEQAQGYSASGTLADFQKEATRTIVAKGYAITSSLACIQYGFPIETEGHWRLDCTVGGSSKKFSVTVWASFFRTYQVVPTNTGESRAPDPPIGMSFSPKDGDYVFVSVAMSR